MAPFVHTEDTIESEDGFPKLVAPQAAPREYSLVYHNIIYYVYMHTAAVYGLYIACTIATWKTLIFSYVLYSLATFGVTVGAHRLWTHRTFKAKLPLQIILMVMNSIAYQNAAVHWVRDHRIHHRYSDTDADPHNATRGLFFSHVGWLLVRKHPEVKRRGQLVNMSDIYANPVLMFQKKYAFPFMGTLCFALPTLIPMVFFGETLNTAWNITVLRYLCNLHEAFLINSLGHLWGCKPYDKHMKPTQNVILSLITFGEGNHNYHHVFPWDYRTAELGHDWLNLNTKFIDFFAWVGWAYDLKTIPADVIQTRVERTGDGSKIWGHKRKVEET